jgi:hypothetical protein
LQSCDDHGPNRMSFALFKKKEEDPSSTKTVFCFCLPSKSKEAPALSRALRQLSGFL